MLLFVRVAADQRENVGVLQLLQNREDVCFDLKGRLVGRKLFLDKLDPLSAELGQEGYLPDPPGAVRTDDIVHGFQSDQQLRSRPWPKNPKT